MEAYIRCNICNGQKTVTPLGGIAKKCLSCNGSGFQTLNNKSVTIKDESLHNNSSTSEPKKRGRPKVNS